MNRNDGMNSLGFTRERCLYNGYGKIYSLNKIRKDSTASSIHIVLA